MKNLRNGQLTNHEISRDLNLRWVSGWYGILQYWSVVANEYIVSSISHGLPKYFNYPRHLNNSAWRKVKINVYFHIVSQHINAWHFLRKQLTHWSRVTHICVSKLSILGSDNGLSPGRRQAIIWTNAGILLIGPLGRNFSEILIEINTFSLKKLLLKTSSAKWRPFCLGLNELTKKQNKKTTNKWLEGPTYFT